MDCLSLFLSSFLNPPIQGCSGTPAGPRYLHRCSDISSFTTICLATVYVTLFYLSESSTFLHFYSFIQVIWHDIDTGKSLSEALILPSINPLCDNRLFIELQEKYKLSTCCVHKLFWMSKQTKNTICNSMNNLLSYNGLIDARMRASLKDLPV